MSAHDGTAGYYCYRCGTAWRETWIVCESCGSSDKAYGSSRPVLVVTDDSKRYPGPWQMIDWPAPGTVMIFGGPGAGKSSLATLIRPRAWITSEQAPKPVKPLFDRVVPGHMPVVYPAKTPERVAEVLSMIHEGPVVVDSLSAFGQAAAMAVAQLLVDWSNAQTDRALGIVQVTKSGDAAGYMALPHLVDAVIAVQKDASGLRLFNVEKCRWSPEGSMYWTFGTEGGIVSPDFPASYSVEGTANLWLQPYPMGKAQWDDLLRLLDKLDLLQPGVASAAHHAHYMPMHFMEPRDIDQRRAFAERVGLRWISPADVWDQVMDRLEQSDENENPSNLLRTLIRK